MSNSVPLNFNDEIPMTNWGGPEMIVATHSPISFQGFWHLNDGPDSSTNQVVSFGRRGDIPITGDWDGNGRDEIGIVRHNPSNNSYQWFISYSDLRYVTSGASVPGVLIYGGYGGTPDYPVVGDWDGNGTDRMGIARVDGNSLRWILANSWGAPSTNAVYGSNCRLKCIPVVGDWDGNGSDGIGYFRNQTKTWLLRNSVTGGASNYYFSWGSSQDLPLTGDHLYGAIDLPILWRTTSTSPGTWFRKLSLAPNQSTLSHTWGSNDHYPIILDWDTDTQSEYGVGI